MERGNQARQSELQQQSNKKTLMLFSIGPVQEFIAQARRTRDLWFGSYLLSELSKAAAIRLQELGGTLVYPYLSQAAIESKQDEGAYKQLKVPNKVLALIDTDDPKRAAWEVRQAITGKWKQYADEAQNVMQAYINSKMWERQVKDLVEFNAVWSQLGEQPYTVVLERLEQLMTARKTLRDFKQNDPGRLHGEKKSSLDHGRESVLDERRFHEYARYGIKGNETLDAVSVIKRLSHHITDRKNTFPSVCETAFKPFIRTLKEEGNHEAKSCVDNYYSELKRSFPKVTFTGQDLDSYDSRLFYASRIEEYVNEWASNSASKEERKTISTLIAESLNKLHSTLSTKHNIEFTPYYAFILCDGDRMGELQKKMTSVTEHQNFSKQLSLFAARAEEIVREHDGDLIYSGGDDVMAYVPIHHCLQASDELRLAFENVMEAAVPDGQQPPTLSVGIAIVHMREPLEEVRQLAQKAERMAKVRKNELAIIYQKRNGGDLMKVSLPFKTEDSKVSPVQNIYKLQDCYQQRLFTAQFAYGLRARHQQYSKMLKQSHWHVQGSTLQQLLKQEVERLLWKKKVSDVSEKEVTAKLLPCLLPTMETGNNPLEQLRMLAEQVIIAITLAKAGAHSDEPITNTTT